jgi:pimeloyl-ACP methyl ester carboxylesterase
MVRHGIAGHMVFRGEVFVSRFLVGWPGRMSRSFGHNATNLAGIMLGALLLMPALTQAVSAADQLKSGAVNIGNDITLHYIEQGSGIPVIFVHGSLSDLSYWQDQVVAFSKSYRAIAYSRRYNFPNQNPTVTGYSAITDADDLAAFIAAMHLGKVYILGHSYGALTGLFLATRHPELIRALVIAEPPAVSLLQHLSNKNAQRGEAMYADVYRRMVTPMKAKFTQGDPDAGVGIFMDYVFNDPKAWEKMSPEDRADPMRNAHEWEVMMPQGTLFPELAPLAVRNITSPVLIISGGKTIPFLALLDRELAQLIPGSRNIVFADAGHQMWLQHPVECRDAAEAFFRAHIGP